MNQQHEWLALGRIDLNLFRLFEVIYRERNLTRAAAVLNLSQSAVSHALNRLRELIARAAFIPVVRRPTKPTRNSQKKRVESKIKRGLVKMLRGRVSE